MSERLPEATVWDALRGALVTRALGVVADLGVADALADGPRPVADVAREVGANPDSLHRILRALASDGIFEEHEPGVFGNTSASELLRDGSWSAFAHLFGGVFHTAARDLEPVTGKATFPDRFGTGFWDWLGDQPGERASFDRAMGGSKEVRVDQLAGLEWRDGETVVDVGGGNGAFLLQLLARLPALRGIVFDLPETVRDDEALGERIEFVEGSFFDSVPAGDAYVLGRILHDWDDERAAAILRTIRESAPDGARLFLFESVIAPGNDPDGAKWLDLLMLVLAGGRERTEEDWRALLDATGFEPVTIEDGLIQARCR